MDGHGARRFGQQRAVVLLVVLGVVLAISGQAFVLLRDFAPLPPTSMWVLHVVGGLAYLGLAVYVGWRRPANPIGVLLALAGVLWFATDLASSNDPRLFTLGLVLSAGVLPVYLHIAVAMPTGHLRTLADRATVVAGYVVVFGFQAASWMVVDSCRAPVEVPDCPGNLLVVTHDPGLARALDTVSVWSLVGIMGVVVVLVTGRLRRSPRPVRPAMVAVLVAVLVQGYDVVTGLLALVPEGGPWADELWWKALESMLLDQTLAIAIIIWMVRYEMDRSLGLVVAATDIERRRIERDLHDGAQQQLLGIAVDLDRVARDLDEGGGPLARARVERAVHRLHQTVEDLRGLTRGVHPALGDRGIAVALEALADGAPLPIELGAVPSSRLPDALERAVCFLVSEAVVNAARHAHATHVTVDVLLDGADLTVIVHDDGVGGAGVGRGTGLRGLHERFHALEGDLTVDSPPGQGTTIVGRLPVPRPAPA